MDSTEASLHKLHEMHGDTGSFDNHFKISLFSIYFLPYIAILQFLEDRGQEKNSLGIVAAGAFSGVLSQG